jgi:hypothetical protein
LLRIGLAGGALLATPVLIARANSAGARSPFDAPADVPPDSDAGGTARPRRRGRTRPGPPEPIVTRVEWRADEHIRSRRIEFDRRIEKIVVHHTGTKSTAPDWPSEVRAIYHGVIARGLRDMPYHWLIDPDGTVYEGRWARTVAPGTVPNGEDRYGRTVRGGHALGYNERTIGIALLGTFDDHRPTLAAFGALVTLVAWQCDRHHIVPAGATPYRQENGTETTFPNLCPHRQVRATDCPGRAVVDLLPQLRLATAQRLGAS